MIVLMPAVTEVSFLLGRWGTWVRENSWRGAAKTIIVSIEVAIICAFGSCAIDFSMKETDTNRPTTIPNQPIELPRIPTTHAACLFFFGMLTLLILLLFHTINSTLMGYAAMLESPPASDRTVGVEMQAGPRGKFREVVTEAAPQCIMQASCFCRLRCIYI
jgi:hypothetical protein